MSGTADHLVVDEPAERETGLDRIDVREPRQVADDRADARAAPASRRQRVARAARAAHLERALARELEHLPVQQEEAGEPEPRDQRELFVEPLANAFLVAVRVRIPIGERDIADLVQLHVGRIVAVGEVGVAVAELLRQIERAPVGDLARAQRRVARQPLEHLLRREEHALVVAAPLALAAVERRAVLDRDERVLQVRTADVVCVHVTGRDRRHAERTRELVELCIAAYVAALVRALQLDVEARSNARASRAAAFGSTEPSPCRAQPESATSPSACCSSMSIVVSAGSRSRSFPWDTRARVRVGEDPAEVRVAALVRRAASRARRRRASPPRR